MSDSFLVIIKGNNLREGRVLSRHGEEIFKYVILIKDEFRLTFEIALGTLRCHLKKDLSLVI